MSKTRVQLAAMAATAGLLLGVMTTVPNAADADMRVAQAAKRRDVAAVRTLLRAGADVNAVEADGSSALLWAAYHSNTELVRMLLDAGAKPDVRNRYGISPLLQASRLGHMPTIQALVDAGADINLAQSEGETPLMAAAAAGSLEAVNLFIRRGANVEARERAYYQTALVWAAGEGHLAVVNALLEAGANPNATSRIITLSRGRGDGGRMWVDFTSGGLSALMFAARGGQVDVVRRLVDAGATVNYANPDGLTALLIAVINDETDVAAALLEKGANPNDGSLYEAVVLNNVRLNETVGEATRPRPRHENPITPLQLIERMLARGADPMRTATYTLHGDTTGQPEPVNQTPFLRALQAQDVDVLRLMIASGANVNLAMETGTALMTALQGGARFGGGFGVQPAAYRFAGTRSAIEAVRLLLDAGADVNGVRENGDTALHIAAQTGNLEMIQLLADRGARLDAKNDAGFTPLDAANGTVAPGGGGGRRGGGGGPGRGGAPRPQPEAIALLQQLMAAQSLSQAQGN
jgi:ankyrin repeat protein